MIEVLISLGMITLIVASIGAALTANNRLGQAGSTKDQALAYARESMEVVAQQANSFFAQCPGNLNCWIAFDSTQPYFITDANTLVAGTETLNTGQMTMTRSITFTDLRRDANGDIVASGGTVDPSSKKVTVVVSWVQHGQSKNVTLSTILTRWKNV